MKKMFKKMAHVAFALAISATSVFAAPVFNDLNENHWAYSQIMNLAQNKFSKKFNEQPKEKIVESNFQWFDKITSESGEVILGKDEDAKSFKSISTFQFSDDGLFSQPLQLNEKEIEKKSNENDFCDLLDKKSNKNHSEEEVEKIVKDDLKVLSMQLTQYKRPSTVIIKREPLPRTTTRKVKRNDVKKLIEV